MIGDDNDDDEDYSVWTDDPDLRTPVSRNLSIVHPDFRLFVTTRVGSGRPLPVVLIQRGLKLACESKSRYRSTMRQVFEVGARSMNSWTSYWNTPFTNQIKVGISLSSTQVLPFCAVLYETIRDVRNFCLLSFFSHSESGWNHHNILIHTIIQLCPKSPPSTPISRTV